MKSSACCLNDSTRLSLPIKALCKTKLIFIFIIFLKHFSNYNFFSNYLCIYFIPVIAGLERRPVCCPSWRCHWHRWLPGTVRNWGMMHRLLPSKAMPLPIVAHPIETKLEIILFNSPLWKYINYIIYK